MQLRLDRVAHRVLFSLVWSTIVIFSQPSVSSTMIRLRANVRARAPRRAKSARRLERRWRTTSAAIEP